jgi:PST family polysaccharide transporter
MTLSSESILATNPGGSADAGAESRKSKLVRSGATTVAGQCANVLITTGSTVILARMLDPADFGLLAMVFSLIVFIGTFRDFGLPMAALQSRDLDHRQSSALFWINLWITLAVGLLMILMAPLLAWFYGDARLVLLTAVMSAGVVVPALANQHEAMLTRQLRFIWLVKLDLSFLVAGSVAAICLAAAGAGYWALVAQFLIWQVGRGAAVWVVSGWTPARFGEVRGSWQHVRHLVSVGAHLTGFRVVSHAGRDLDRVLVGYIGGAHTMGLYDAALRWARLPLHQIYTPLLGVAVAGLSHVRDDAEAYRRTVRAITTPVLGFSVPILAYAAVAADALIMVLLGAKWLESIPLFRALCVGTVALAALKTTKWLYVATGNTKRQFHWALFSSPLFAIAIATGSFFGAQGVAVGYAVTQWLLLVPGLAYCLHGSPVTLPLYIRILARPLTASTLAAAAAWLLGRHYNLENHLAQLLLTGPAFVLVYATTWLALPGGRQAALDMKQLIRTLRPGARWTAKAFAGAATNGP